MADKSFQSPGILHFPLNVSLALQWLLWNRRCDGRGLHRLSARRTGHDFLQDLSLADKFQGSATPLRVFRGDRTRTSSRKLRLQRDFFSDWVSDLGLHLNIFKKVKSLHSGWCRVTPSAAGWWYSCEKHLESVWIRDKRIGKNVQC